MSPTSSSQAAVPASPHPLGLERIVSGGQTGVDRAALDVALAIGLPCGGWCPKGRLAEDGPIDPRYPLRDTPTDGYAERTTWNVRDSDGTLILNEGPLATGTRQTAEDAARLHRPCLIVQLDGAAVRDQLAQLLLPLDLMAGPRAADRVRAWLLRERIRILNVAGPRESKCPGIMARAAQLLRAVIHPTDGGSA